MSLSHTHSSFILFSVDCGIPIPPLNGKVNDLNSTKGGTIITYQCDEGFIPSDVQQSSCINPGVWVPIPQEITCVLIESKKCNSYVSKNRDQL